MGSLKLNLEQKLSKTHDDSGSFGAIIPYCACNIPVCTEVFMYQSSLLWPRQLGQFEAGNRYDLHIHEPLLSYNLIKKGNNSFFAKAEIFS